MYIYMYSAGLPVFGRRWGSNCRFAPTYRAAQTANDTVLECPRGVLQYGPCPGVGGVPWGLTCNLPNRHFPIQMLPLPRTPELIFR